MGRLSKKKPAAASQAKSQTKITGFFQTPSQNFTKIEEGGKGEKIDGLKFSPAKTTAVMNGTNQKIFKDGEKHNIDFGDNK